MSWYKVWMVVPGTDGDAENGPCSPVWWVDMEQAVNEEMAIQQANDKAQRQWEEPNHYAPGVEAPSDKDMGQECPVCTGALAVTDEDYMAWKREQDEADKVLFD